MRKAIPKSDLWFIKNFLLNAVQSSAHEIQDDSHDLVLWVLKHQNDLEFPDYCCLSEEEISLPIEERELFGRKTRLSKSRNKKSFQSIWNEWNRQFARHVKLSKTNSQSKIQKTANWIAQLCDLPETETNALLFLAMCEKYQILKALSAAVQNKSHRFSHLRTGIDEDALQCIVGFDCEGFFDLDELKICKYGLAESRHGNLRLSRNIIKIFLLGIEHEEELKSIVIGENHHPKLELIDFQYLDENVSTLARILKNHNEASGNALNIFLYGDPGTGKTEFAKSIGAAVGRSVYFIGEQDENSQDVTRNERVSALMLLGGIKDISNSKILVVDEADEILSDIGANKDIRNKGSKIFLNRLLEGIKTPIIWIVNDQNSIDEAVLRRMSFSVEFPKPPLEVRKSIIAKIADDTKAKMAIGDIDELARYEASPAYFENAIRLSKNIDGDLKITQQILENNLCTSGQITKQIAAKNDFRLDLCNANMDLIALRDQVKSCATTKLTFCFSGIPGTGKSEYARYLAKELGYEILYKRYSDLASMWLGGTEENIARAFREATKKKAFLILDEADSLLQKRENAQKSWEVTQVNEFLTQIENHEFPFAITTNAFDNLDTAAMRRFLFKVKFFAMSRDQIAEAFMHFFGDTAPSELLRIENLTPADFALIRNQAQILGITDKYKLSEMIIDEAASRGAAKQRIGF